MAEDLSSLIPEGRIPVLSPSGQLGTVPKADIKKVISEGFTLPDQPTLRQALVEKKYGGFSQELGAAVAGAGRGATFGLSDVALTKLGLVSPETLAGLQEANPFASGAGQVAGIIGSSLLIPGGGLTGLVSKGAGAAERGVATAIGKGIASKIAGKTIGGALEGAFYGAGQSVSESALGDPTLNAQKVLYNVGLGSLFGGAISGGTTALGAGLKKGGSWLVGKFGRATPELPPTAQAIEGAQAKFGIPDDEILETSQKINPRNPLNKHDLDFLKTRGMPDAEGKPTILKNIGTRELPTLDPMATDKVYMGDVVKEGMGKLQAERIRLNAEADKALQETIMPNKQALSMTKNQYLKTFDDVIDGVKGSKEFGTPIGKRSVKMLNSWREAADDLPETIPATDIRDLLQNIREEGKIYVKGGGLKGDFVSKSLEKVQSTFDDYLKDNSPAYKAVQKDFAPFTRNMIEIEDHLGWNWQRNDSDLVSDWVTNRVAKPFQSTLPGTKHDADLMRWFSQFAGSDLETASKANFIFGKINPESAIGAQKGSWGARVVEGIEALQQPTAIPGKILKGAAEYVLTGEKPSFLQEMKNKELQSILLGQTPASSTGIANRLEASIGKAMKGGSKLLSVLEDFPGAGTAIALDFVRQHENMGDAERKLETLFALERATVAADKKIKSSVSGVFDDSHEKPEQNKKLDEFMGEESSKKGEEWEKLTTEIRQIVNNPQIALDRLSKSIEGLEEAVPQTAAGLNTAAMRALSFLSSKLQFPDKLPLDGKYIPSKNQISQAAKYMKMINNPYTALDELKRGNFSKESKEVLTQIYPELYDHLKARVMEGVANQQAKGKSVAKNKRLGLSYFLDQPLDSGFQQFNLQRNYATMASQPAQSPGVSNKGTTLPQRMLTPMQRVQSR